MKKFIAMALIVAAAVGCTHNWGNVRKISLDAPTDTTDVGTEVTGEDCGFFSQWYSHSIQQAALNALQKAEGAKGLRKVTIEGYSAYIYSCMVVRGTPVK